MTKYEKLPESTKEARSRASMKYTEKAVKQIHLALNKVTDADIIAALEACGNVQGYIKGLIRRDINRCLTCGYFGWNRDSDESCDYWDGCATEPEGFCHKWVHK